MQYLAQIISKLIAYFIIYIMIGLMLEKAWHWNESVEQLARRLKNSTVAVLKILFSKERIRHGFDICLYEDINEILSEYVHNGFQLDYTYGVKDALPYYAVAFVPKENYDKDMMQSITDLVLLKFRDYLSVYDLTFLSFAAYHKVKGRIYVAIFYSEFPEDKEPLKLKYQRTINRKITKDYGILRDPELDKELNLVD